VGVLNEEFADIIKRQSLVICEELNVKEVSVTLNPSELAKIIIKPNFKVLGKTLGDKIKDLQSKLALVSDEVAMKALNKETIKIQDFTLTPESLVVELRPLGSDFVASDAELVVALNGKLTDELKMEGIARELVSFVQKARKNADFNVEDKIYLCFAASTALQSAIKLNKEYIEEETLATLVSNLPYQETKFECENTVEGEVIKILIVKKI
ncbi:MAG: hypothetical protein K2X39_01040, partial [Silvanigrellaceae bacterium]|nr:hypothetical protein [Silvanigrellaceae bacterium]